MSHNHQAPNQSNSPAEQEYHLLPLGQKILKHWQEFRPKMCRDLEKQGKLRQSVYAAQELTVQALYDLEVKQGLPRNQAWELVREQWAFLPAESDQPKINFEPEKLVSRVPRPTNASPTPTG